MDELFTTADFLKSLGEGYKDLIIRWFYVKFAPFFQRDLDFFLASEEERIKMLEVGLKKDSSLVFCKTICEQYKEIYEKYDIKCILVITSQNQKKIPHYGLIVQGDYGWFFIDPIKDLFPNQLGLKTIFFGKIPVKYSNLGEKYPILINLPTSYIEKLDNVLGLLPQGIYMDTFFSLLHKEMTNNKIASFFGIEKRNQFLLMKKKLEFMERYLINLGNIPGLFERNTFYTYLFSQIFNKREIHYISSSILKEEEQYKLSICLKPKFEGEQSEYYEECKSEEGIYFLKNYK